MDRREFIQLSASAATLASSGLLPLLGAEKRRPGGRRRNRLAPVSGPRNIFTEPAAIEPITGYLPRFIPAGDGSMKGPFAATYSLIQMQGSQAKSRNRVSGSLKVSFADAICTSSEIRTARPANTVRNRVRCAGDLNLVKRWTLKSSVTGAPDLGFTEIGSWDGKQMIVKSNSWTQTRAVSNRLIAQWALPGLLAAGKFRDKPLQFDMLDNSTLRPDQTLSYSGRVEVPTAKGKIKLDCYAQTGRGILPIHYLVDTAGRVQLITHETVNWALTKLS
jgi:hypothetical protein